jgi:acetyl esterase/lipase
VGAVVTASNGLQMYTTNELLSHPLVSPIMQPSLGGLPPLLVMVGGGEILRDEQIYLAHKCANPSKYPPPESALDDRGREQINQYKPTDVQLQVWDDLCHVAPTLSFTRPAKYMYRSVAQFSAWALARAQKRDIEILDDDDISVISTSSSDSDKEEVTKVRYPLSTRPRISF